MALGISISKETIDLCMTIVENSITCDFPYANTEASKAFTLIAGPHSTKILLSVKLVLITFMVILIMCAPRGGGVGQSILLGHRVREDANLRFSTTSSYITSLQSAYKNLRRGYA